MDLTVFWSAVGAIGGIGVSLAVGYLTYRRQFPRRELNWWITTTRFDNDVSSPNAPAFTIGDVKTKDPYVCTFSLYSNSRADIPSVSFDQGAAVSIRLVSPFVAAKEQHENSTITVARSAHQGEAGFLVLPQLIRRRSRADFLFLSAQPPKIEVRSPLVDIDIVQLSASQGEARVADLRRKLAVRIGAGVLVAALALGMVLVIVSTR